ncbi:MAG: lysylphosphatidylglycerol synthase transmembrane domain-containing protein [Paludibacteraceae bacterium]
MTPEKRKRIYQNIFFLLGLLMLFIMAYKLGFDAICKNLKQTGWWFLPIIAIWIVVYFLNALCLKIILRDGSAESKDLSIWKVMKITTSAYGLNYITPLSLGGEPYKILELKKNLGGKKATSADLLYVMMHYVSHFFFWMISVPLFLLVVPEISDFGQMILWGMIIGSLLLVTWAYTVYTKGVIWKSLSVGTKIPFFGKKIKIYRDKNLERFHEMDFLIAELYTKRKKDFFLSLGVELLSRYISCFEVYFMAIPLGFDLYYLQSILIVSFATLVANLFFFAPMQMGTREGGFALAVGLLHIPLGVGVYIGLCTRIRELFWVLAGIALMKINLPKSDSEI